MVLMLSTIFFFSPESIFKLSLSFQPVNSNCSNRYFSSVTNSSLLLLQFSPRLLCVSNYRLCHAFSCFGGPSFSMVVLGYCYGSFSAFHASLMFLFSTALQNFPTTSTFSIVPVSRLFLIYSVLL